LRRTKSGSCRAGPRSAPSFVDDRYGGFPGRCRSAPSGRRNADAPIRTSSSATTTTRTPWLNGVRGIEYAGLLQGTPTAGCTAASALATYTTCSSPRARISGGGFKDTLPTGTWTSPRTVARVLGLALQGTDGRPLLEAMEGPAPGDYRVESEVVQPDAPATGLTIQLATDPGGGRRSVEDQLYFPAPDQIAPVRRLEAHVLRFGEGGAAVKHTVDPDDRRRPIVLQPAGRGLLRISCSRTAAAAPDSLGVRRHLSRAGRASTSTSNRTPELFVPRGETAAKMPSGCAGSASRSHGRSGPRDGRGVLRNGAADRAAAHRSRRPASSRRRRGCLRKQGEKRATTAGEVVPVMHALAATTCT